jgi:dephospho-CoA kinase
MKRDGSDADRVRAVLAGQWPVSVKRKKADFVVSNGAGPDSFDRRLVRVLDALRRDGR